MGTPPAHFRADNWRATPLARLSLTAIYPQIMLVTAGLSDSVAVIAKTCPPMDNTFFDDLIYGAIELIGFVLAKTGGGARWRNAGHS